ncbi:hypothetical protein BJ912DRAFT_1057086 [Pholiota molesta]|nr:hypothetical protein BJ912DRAFT_1057086 [Pholiota molesta]
MLKELHLRIFKCDRPCVRPRFAVVVHSMLLPRGYGEGVLHAQIYVEIIGVWPGICVLHRYHFNILLDMECVSDIAKIQAQFEHLAETYFDGF